MTASHCNPLADDGLTFAAANAIDDPELMAAVAKAAGAYAAQYLGGDPYIPTTMNLIAYARNEQGQTVAFAAWQEWEGKGFVGLAWVHPFQRGQGVYRRLLDMVEAECQRRGLTAVACAVDTRNAASIKVHDRLMKKAVILYERPVTARQGDSS
jgi:GNAT superfamily N-acetyltransferase